MFEEYADHHTMAVLDDDPKLKKALHAVLGNKYF